MQSIEPAGRHDQPVEVLIVDDHPIFRQGIRHLLESEQGVRGIGEAGSIEEATGWLKARHVDVILLDHNLPDVNGVDGMSRLFQIQGDLQVIVLTVCDDDDVLIRAIRSGACGYMLKDVPPERLIEAIKAAGRGECRVSGSLVRSLFARASRSEGSRQGQGADNALPCILPGGEALTQRDREVLACLIKGESNKEIARDLGLSPNTIRNQLQRLQGRFGARNRVQLALLARDCCRG
ncbi:MAG: response regulator transcription factor [Gammaproteobacteria bacterium]|nr:response regulator transcription factor [Gammaproteobacteria bacterium]